MALKLALLSLASLPAVCAETVLGAYIFHRHGDRTPKSLPPTNLTSLGADQVFASGNFFRNRYVASGGSSPVYRLSHDVAVASQMAVTAPIDVVLQNSALVFIQGLYPPISTLSSETLANGSTVQAPLGGYQYIPINAVATASSNANSENSEWLQGGSGCNNAVVSSNNYFASADYLGLLNSTRTFYQDLLPVINGTFPASQANFKNGYTIFDLINVATIHNSSIPSGSLLTRDTLRTLQVLANQHEWGLAYNETDKIRAIAGSTLAAQILQQLNSTLTGKSAQPLNIQFGAYASFLSFFGLAQLPKASPDFTGIVDYASAMVFELVSSRDNVSAASYPAGGDVSVRFLFTNGSAAEHGLTAYPLFGQSQTLLPWNTFVSEMNKFAIGDSKSWCAACGNSTGLCADPASASGSSTSGGGAGASATPAPSGSNISLPVAGVIGAMVTLVVILAIEALVFGLAGLTLVRKSSVRGKTDSVTEAGSPKA